MITHKLHCDVVMSLRFEVYQSVGAIKFGFDQSFFVWWASKTDLVSTPKPTSKPNVGLRGWFWCRHWYKHTVTSCHSIFWPQNSTNTWLVKNRFPGTPLVGSLRAEQTWWRHNGIIGVLYLMNYTTFTRQWKYSSQNLAQLDGQGFQSINVDYEI